MICDDNKFKETLNKKQKLRNCLYFGKLLIFKELIIKGEQFTCR